MKLLIADTTFPRSHKVLNNKIIDIINKIDFISHITVLNCNSYYHQELYKGISFVDVKLFFTNRRRVDKLTFLINALIIRFKMLFLSYDSVIFTTFNTFSFFIISFLSTKPIYIFHHNNTDQLQDKRVRRIFYLYKNQVHHLVFASYMKDFLISLGVHEQNIDFVPHPIPSSCVLDSAINLPIYKKKFVALGQGNDEDLISSIIEYETHMNVLEVNNIELVIRSKKLPSKKIGNINIINGFLSRKEYEEHYLTTQGVLILYPKSFKNRFSGSILDAFCSQKYVIGRNIPIVNYFKEEYPNSCFVFDSVEELFHMLIGNYTVDEMEYLKFLSIHSDDNIKKYFYEILW